MARVGSGNYRHGMSNTPTWRAWQDMRKRCDNPNSQDYKNYGARGITYDPRWSRFENFLEDMGVCPSGKTLDRIDNAGNYDSYNCRWATRSEQNSNTRKNVYITFQDRTQTAAQWARELGLSPSVISTRIRNYGLSNPEVILRPLNSKARGR